MTDHISDLNYEACLDIVTAMSTYKDFIAVSRDLVEAEEVSFRDLLKSWTHLGLITDDIFFKLDKKAVERMLSINVGDEDEDENNDFRFAYDDLLIFELLDD